MLVKTPLTLKPLDMFRAYFFLNLLIPVLIANNVWKARKSFPEQKKNVCRYLITEYWKDLNYYSLIDLKAVSEEQFSSLISRRAQTKKKNYYYFFLNKVEGPQFLPLENSQEKDAQSDNPASSQEMYF